MKENRISFLMSLLISIMSITLLIMAEYNSAEKFTYCKIFPFLIGHRSFWENILISIFSGAILILFSTGIGYLINRSRNDNNIIKIFYYLSTEILRFESIPERRNEIFIEKVRELWWMSCEYYREDSPFYILRKRHLINKEIHYLIRDICKVCIEYEYKSCNDARELLNKVKDIKEDYIKIDTYFKNINIKYRKKLSNE